MSPARLALLAFVGLSACGGRYGRDGLSLFPQASPQRAFFGSCSHNLYKGMATWFCDTSESFGLVEQREPRTHDQSVQDFIANDETLGVFKGKLGANLAGELAGMQLSTLGFERTYEPPVPTAQWIVFLGTQQMPDGTGIALSCTITADKVSDVSVVKKCHEGIKLLRDAMLQQHAR